MEDVSIPGVYKYGEFNVIVLFHNVFSFIIIDGINVEVLRLTREIELLL